MKKLNELKFYYKFENELLPNYFKKTQEHNANIGTEQTHFTLKQNNQIHQYNTRQKNNLHIPRSNKLFTSKCIRHNIPITVNSSPEYLLNKIYSHSIELFAKSIKELYINKYSNTCFIANCYICNKN